MPRLDSTFDFYEISIPFAISVDLRKTLMLIHM